MKLSRQSPIVPIRYPDCGSYDDCLILAALDDAALICSDCVNYHPVPMDESDFLALIRLAAEILEADTLPAARGDFRHGQSWLDSQSGQAIIVCADAA